MNTTGWPLGGALLVQKSVSSRECVSIAEVGTAKQLSIRFESRARHKVVGYSPRGRLWPAGVFLNIQEEFSNVTIFLSFHRDSILRINAVGAGSAESESSDPYRREWA
jgi:hypothetical protein